MATGPHSRHGPRSARVTWPAQTLTWPPCSEPVLSKALTRMPMAFQQLWLAPSQEQAQESRPPRVPLSSPWSFSPPARRKRVSSQPWLSPWTPGLSAAHTLQTGLIQASLPLLIYETCQMITWLCACEITPIVCNASRPHGLQPARLLCPWDSPGKNTGVSCHASSKGSSRPRDRTKVS